MQTTMNNNVQLIGHLGRNPEVKTLDNGTKVARLTLATSSYKRNANGDRETQTQWHNLSVWGKQAEVAEKFLIKGKHVAVSGKLNNRAYVDNTGTKRVYTEILVNSFQMFN
jgi:single-strand DNA-binding protein